MKRCMMRAALLVLQVDSTVACLWPQIRHLSLCMQAAAASASTQHAVLETASAPNLVQSLADLDALKKFAFDSAKEDGYAHALFEAEEEREARTCMPPLMDAHDSISRCMCRRKTS